MTVMSHRGVRLTLGLDELLPSHEWHVSRHDIYREGSLGVANGYGRILLLVNGKAVLSVILREDEQGEAVLDVSATQSFSQPLGADKPHFDIPLEQLGLVGRRLAVLRGDA